MVQVVRLQREAAQVPDHLPAVPGVRPLSYHAPWLPDHQPAVHGVRPLSYHAKKRRGMNLRIAVRQALNLDLRCVLVPAPWLLGP